MSNSQWHHDQNLAARAEAEQERKNRLVREASLCGPMEQAMLSQLGQQPNVNGTGIANGLGAYIARAAPGKMFTRETILSIIRAERTKWFNDGTDVGGVRYRAAMDALDAMQHIFERLE